jgi:hypothetical protein
MKLAIPVSTGRNLCSASRMAVLLPEQPIILGVRMQTVVRAMPRSEARGPVRES